VEEVILYDKCDELFGCFPADIKFEEYVVVGAALLLAFAGGVVVWHCAKEDGRTDEEKAEDEEDEVELLAIKLQRDQQSITMGAAVQNVGQQPEQTIDAVLSIVPGSRGVGGALEEHDEEGREHKEEEGGERAPMQLSDAEQLCLSKKELDQQQAIAADSAWQALWESDRRTDEEKAQARVAKTQAQTKAKARAAARREHKSRGRPVFAHLLSGANVLPAGPPAAPLIPASVGRNAHQSRPTQNCQPA
jgi:hypothetical protein